MQRQPAGRPACLPAYPSPVFPQPALWSALACPCLPWPRPSLPAPAPPPDPPSLPVPAPPLPGPTPPLPPWLQLSMQVATACARTQPAATAASALMPRWDGRGAPARTPSKKAWSLAMPRLHSWETLNYKFAQCAGPPCHTGAIGCCPQVPPSPAAAGCAEPAQPGVWKSAPPHIAGGHHGVADHKPLGTAAARCAVAGCCLASHPCC